jgi:type II secretory pathway component PulK
MQHNAAQGTIKMPPGRDTSQSSGFALLSTLWVLCILGITGACFAFSSRTETKAAGFSLRRSQAYFTARAAIHRAAAVIREHAHDPLHTATATWWTSPELYREVHCGRSRASVVRDDAPLAPAASDGAGPWYGLDDEESRLNINVATPEMLMQYPGISSALAEDIVLFIKKKKKTKSDERQKAGLTEKAPPQSKETMVTGPIRQFVELLAIPGVSRELLFGDPAAKGAGGLARELTCFSSGKVNVNTARPTALTALGLNEGQVNTILALRREGFPGFREIGEFTTVLNAHAADAPSTSGQKTTAAAPGFAKNTRTDEKPPATAKNHLPATDLLDVKSRNFRLNALVADMDGADGYLVRSRLTLDEQDMAFTMFQALDRESDT